MTSGRQGFLKGNLHQYLLAHKRPMRPRDLIRAGFAASNVATYLKQLVQEGKVTRKEMPKETNGLGRKHKGNGRPPVFYQAVPTGEAMISLGNNMLIPESVWNNAWAEAAKKQLPVTDGRGRVIGRLLEGGERG